MFWSCYFFLISSDDILYIVVVLQLQKMKFYASSLALFAATAAPAAFAQHQQNKPISLRASTGLHNVLASDAQDSAMVAV